MNFAFFGTDEFSVKVLQTLKEKGLTPKLIITILDKPRGRKMVLTPPPAKVWAQEKNIEVIQPVSLRETPTTLGLIKGSSAGVGGLTFSLLLHMARLFPKRFWIFRLMARLIFTLRCCQGIADRHRSKRRF